MLEKDFELIRGHEDSCDIAKDNKIAFLDAQISSIKDLLWRERVEYMSFIKRKESTVTESEESVLVGKISEKRANIKEYILSIENLIALKKELE